MKIITLEDAHYSNLRFFLEKVILPPGPPFQQAAMAKEFEAVLHALDTQTRDDKPASVAALGAAAAKLQAEADAKVAETAPGSTGNAP